MATALAKIEGAAIVPPLTPDPLKLAIMNHVPQGYSVAVLAGAVVIYDSAAPEELEEGALYAIEHQRMPHGMAPETYHLHSLDFGRRRLTPIQLRTEREVVRVARWHGDPEHWQYTTARGFTEYPLHEPGLRSLIVGKVVGIYAPQGLEVRQ